MKVKSPVNKSVKYELLSEEIFPHPHSVITTQSSINYCKRPWILLIILGCVIAFSTYYYIYLWEERNVNHWHLSLKDAQKFAMKKILKEFVKGAYRRRIISFDSIMESEESRFNIESADVIVFLHIQKTAGTTLEKHLTTFLDLEKPCFCNKKVRKRCKCYRPNSPKSNWLFSRFSTGWACGLHADWTEMVVSDCVDNKLDEKEHRTVKRRYFYTTFLREPISRYISEYSHVKRGATWSNARYMCKGRVPTPEELPMCFDPDLGWERVNLDEFISCPHNLAANRQTRMLADLTLVNCYDKTTMSKQARQKIMLESAKRNLESIAFFGLQENMRESQYLFERTLNLRFVKDFDQATKSKSNKTKVSDTDLARIKRINNLDIELYEFASKLFYKRLKFIEHRERRERNNSIASDEDSISYE